MLHTFDDFRAYDSSENCLLSLVFGKSDSLLDVCKEVKVKEFQFRPVIDP
jgi:hypothetical protein